MKFWNDVQFFFVYDKNLCNTEDDDPKDAIIYFFPLEIPESTRCALCGQLMGMVHFFSSSFSVPKLIHLRKSKFVLKNVGKYILFLGGNLEMPDSVLSRQLESLYGLFQFYHKSIDDVKMFTNSDKEEFMKKMEEAWHCYLPISQHHGNTLTMTFDVLPSLELPKTGGLIFLRASQILKACQLQPGVLGGCILSSGRLLCSQIPSCVASKFVFISTDNQQLPAYQARISSFLPYGVIIAHIYISEILLQMIVNYVKNKGEKDVHISKDETRLSTTLPQNLARETGDQHSLESRKDTSLPLNSAKMNGVKETTYNSHSNETLKKMCLYIQSHSKTQLFLILDETTGQDLDKLRYLWKTGISSLVDLEMDITHHLEGLPKQVSTNDYCFLRHDKKLNLLKTSRTICVCPIKIEEQYFNRSAQVMNEILQYDLTIQEHSIIFGDSVFYGHKLGSFETYFQKMVREIPTEKNLPAATKLLAAIFLSARDTLQQDYNIFLF